MTGRDLPICLSPLQSILCYNNDIVLDIGSGPGWLADRLKDTVKEVHCCDTSQNIDQGKKRVGHYDNVFFYQLDKKKYTDLSFLKKKCSKIVCVSVVHYYGCIDNVKDLIENVRTIAQPGAYFLIADIITGNNASKRGRPLAPCSKAEIRLSFAAYLVLPRKIRIR